MKIELTRSENTFRKVMGLLFVIFLISAVVFAIIPDHVLRLLNWVGNAFDLKKPLVPSQISITDEIWTTHVAKNVKHEGFKQGLTIVPGTRLWVGMAVTMMVMLMYITALNFLNPRKYMHLIPLLLLSKFTTSGLGFFYFFTAKTYPFFSNLALAIIDVPIFFLVLFVWLRARSAKGRLDDPMDYDEEDYDEEEPE